VSLSQSIAPSHPVDAPRSDFLSFQPLWDMFTAQQPDLLD
jgi:hypothetical protein